MWLILKTYWTQIASASAATALTALLMWALWSLDVNSLNKAHDKAIAAKTAELNAACDADKKITKEVSHELQAQLSDARDQLAAAKRVQQNRCVPTPARSTRGHDATAADQKLHQPDGIYADALLDFAYDAEVVGRQLDSCQSFINKVWSSRQQ